MSIQKKFLKTKPECKVTFFVEVKNADKIEVAGAFNNWQGEQLPLKKQKNGTFKGSLNLPVNNSYEFKYIVNGTSWVNDNEADQFVWNDFASSENGVIIL